MRVQPTLPAEIATAPPTTAPARIVHTPPSSSPRPHAAPPRSSVIPAKAGIQGWEGDAGPTDSACWNRHRLTLSVTPLTRRPPSVIAAKMWARMGRGCGAHLPILKIL